MKLPGQGTLVGRRLGRYQLDDLLGAGGMAEVYRAHEVVRRTNRSSIGPVAVKVLPENLAQDADYVRRFREEAQRVKKLDKRSNIVPVVEAGEDHGLLYLVMPLYKESLRDRLARSGKPPISVAVRIARQVADALASAHKSNVIHRDVKPENILLDEKGAAFLTDFGIARELSPRQGGTLYTLSASGLPVGTPEYMPPEQLLGQHLDQRADVYALGAVLYELLTGTVPYASENPYAVAALVMDGRLRRPRDLNREVPIALDEAVVRALQRNPAERFPTMIMFDSALKQATLFPDQSLSLGGVSNYRLTERLADSDDRMPARGTAAPPLPAGFPRYGTQGGASPDLPYGASAYPAMQDANGVTWVPLVTGALARASLRPIGSRRTQLALMSGIVALLLLAVCGGGGLVAANRLGLTFSSAGGPTLPFGSRATTTAIAPTVTPLPTATATVIQPTPTQPRPTATPVPQLSVSPLQLTRTGHSTCSGQQYITNNSGLTISWQWLSSSPGLPSSFKWGLSSPPQKSITSNGWPSGSLDPGQQPATLYAQMYCSGQSYEIKMTDSLGRSYTFTMQSQ